MINGNLEQFLDTGWFNEAEIFFQGHIYWCEGFETQQGTFHFLVRKWKAEIMDGKYYLTITDKTGTPLDYDDSFFLDGKDEDEVKQKFLLSPIWDGSSFWEVEKRLAWLEFSGKTKVE